MLQIICKIKIHWLPLSLITLLLITILSLTPLTHLPPAPGSDKIHHLFSYALLLFPVALAKPKHWGWITLFFMFWGGLIELIQPCVNRYGEWADMFANTIGLFCGYLIATFVNQASKNDNQ